MTSTTTTRQQLQHVSYVQHTLFSYPRLPLFTWVCAGLPTKLHHSCLGHGIPASPALCLVRWPRRAIHASFDNGRPCLRRSRPTRVEQASWFCPVSLRHWTSSNDCWKLTCFFSVLTSCWWQFLIYCEVALEVTLHLRRFTNWLFL